MRLGAQTASGNQATGNQVTLTLTPNNIIPAIFACLFVFLPCPYRDTSPHNTI